MTRVKLLSNGKKADNSSIIPNKSEIIFKKFESNQSHNLKDLYYKFFQVSQMHLRSFFIVIETGVFALFSDRLICTLHAFLLVVVFIKIVNLASCLMLPYGNDEICYIEQGQKITLRSIEIICFKIFV